MRGLVILVLATLAVGTFSLLGIRGCTFRDPPVRFWSGMVDQNRVNPQSTSTFYADGNAARVPPKGAVAYGRDAKAPDARFALDLNAAYAEAKIPVPVDEKLLDRGAEIFGITCALCHGAAGDGQGIITKYGMTPPPSFHQDRLRKLSDGEIFKTITLGKNTMGPYGGRIRPADRWAVVAWLRVLQRSQGATLEDVPADRRAELER